MPVGDILPEIAVLLTAVAALLTVMFVPHGRQWVGAPISLLGLAIAAVLCAAQMRTATLTFSGVWAIDGASVWGRLIILAVSGFTLLLVPAWLKSDRRHGEFYALLLFSTLGAMALTGAADLLQLVMGVLLTSVTGYTLAAYHRDWPLSVEAGMKYFLVGALANTALVLGVALMFGMLGSTDYSEMKITLAGPASSPLLILGVGLVLVGLTFKLGAAPAHTWMPDVAEGAPVPAAAFLTVVPKVGAAIALARLVSLFPPDTLAIRPILAILSVVTMTLGNLAALWQDDVRRLVGWSSVSQSGYALMAVVVVGLSTSALSALLFFLLAYSIANMAAFAAIAHLRGRTELRGFSGLAQVRPWVALTIILSFLSLVGIPPLVGFIGKLQLFVATIDGDYGWLAAAAVANTVVSLFYYLRVIGPMYFDPADGRPSVLSNWTAVASFIGAGSLIAVGLSAGLFLEPMALSNILP